MRKSRFSEEQIIGVLKEATVSDVRRLKELEQENTRLKKPLAEAELDKSALKDLLSRKW